jgi:hypothetical protein
VAVASRAALGCPANTVTAELGSFRRTFAGHFWVSSLSSNAADPVEHLRLSPCNSSDRFSLIFARLIGDSKT